jgi:CHASE3 domain sensor protein
MDKEKKEFIEETTKSEYFDFILEKEVEKKARELTQRYKWIFSVIMFFFVVIASIFGWQLSDISKKKDEINFLSYKMTLESARLENNIKTKKEEIDNLFSYITGMNDRQLSYYEKEYGNLNQKVEQNLNKTDNLSDSTRSFNITTEKKLEEMQSKIEKTDKEFNDKKETWQKVINEVKNTSSVVYAYVERGNDREPGTKEYKPAFVNLPFSDKMLTITFNRKSTYRGNADEPGKGVKIKKKEVEVFISFYDEKLQRKVEEVLILRERKPTEIPNTNHMIEAKFIYLPPNPTFVIWPMVIPDFVILEITLNPSKMKI